MITMMSRRRFFALCGASSLASIGASSLVSAAGTPVRVAYTAGLSVPQITMAFERDLWTGQDIQALPVTFPTGREALEALLNGGAEIASLADLPATTAALRNQDLVILGVAAKFVANRFIFNKASGASSIAELNGKRLGVAMGTNMEYLAETVLAEKDISPEIVNVGPGDTILALARGDIDAAVVFDTFYGMARETLGDNYAEELTPQYEGHFVICASQSFAESNPEAVKAVIRALVAADEIVEAEPDETAAAISESTGGALSLGAIQEQMPNYAYGLSLDDGLLRLMVAEGKWITESGIIQGNASEELFRSYIADEYLADIAADRVSLQ